MKIAYITNCFGTQSHTFIRREIEQLAAIDTQIVLFGIHRDMNAKSAIQEETHYLYPFGLVAVIKANSKVFLKQPIRYIRGVVAAFSSPEISIIRRSKMLYHYFASALLGETLKAQEITQIHAHFMNVSASIGMYAAYHFKLPFSITVHSAGTFGTPHILGIAQKLGCANTLFMISHYNIEYFEQYSNCRDKSIVVRCGMDLPAFPFQPKANPIGSPVKLLAVGRSVEKKGFKYLIDAMHLLKKQGTNALLTIIGDGPLANSLQKQAQDLCVPVEFLGQQPTEKVRQAMVDNDIVIVPSVTSQSGEMEGLPVVIMEAMAIGRIVIATRHAGIPEIVISQKTGFLVDEKSPEQIAEAVTQACNGSDQAKLPQQARTLIENEFNMLTIAQKRKRAFEEIEQKVY